MSGILTSVFIFIFILLITFWGNLFADISLYEEKTFIYSYFNNLAKEDFLSAFILLASWVLYEIHQKKQEKKQN